MVEGAAARRRCAVLGAPIAHSLSPALHAAAYRHLGLDWEYGRHEVDEAGLAPFLDALDGSWRGLSLTMPLKQVALDCVDEVSPLARLVQAVNAVVLEPGGRRWGDNTDVPGMVAALREQGVSRVPTATLLGGGATARSALACLREVTDRVVVHVRSPARAAHLLPLADELGLACQVRPWDERSKHLQAPLVVLTTPAGATEDLETAGVSSSAVLFDVAYHPWPTPAARAWAAAGARVVSGLDLLVHQAVRQVELMTGRTVPVDVLRTAGLQALSARDV